MAKVKKVTIEEIEKRYRSSGRFAKKWRKEALKDLEYALGEQWEKKIKDKIESEGRPALTLNIIRPNIRLVSGYQRDSRASIKAYPEGGEDQLTSEIVTLLLKNVIKRSGADNVISEAFETCITARGKAFIEPYIDYTYDLLNGSLQFNVLDGWEVRMDPNSIKYDLSDGRYLFKEKPLTKEEIVELFPDKKKEIDEGIEQPLSDDEGITDEADLLELKEDYPNTEEMDEDLPLQEDEKTYKFLEYFYKRYTTRYLAISVDKNIAQFYTTKSKAMRRLAKNSKELDEGDKIIEKKIPEIWKISSVGRVILDDSLSEGYPNWRNFPLIGLFGWYSAVGKRVLKREDLAYQGLVSGLRDPQDEKNKRRSQSLHIINVIANRGWIAEEDSWVSPKKVEKFGSTPGVTLEYKKGRAEPKQLQPGGVPQAHIYFEEKSEEDIKLISGINPDMLSVQDKTTSGRAIALRQAQGLKILKPLFDNLAQTQEQLGKYIVSQLSELFTVDKALKVLGGEFIDKHFREDDTNTPEIITAKAAELVEQVLNDPELANYDVSIGQGLESPTERYAQYSTLLELAEKGIPIPPQVLIEYSDIPLSAKKDIQAALKAATPEPGAGQ